MGMKEYTDLMIDIETLGNEGQFVVTQIALVPFNIDQKEENLAEPYESFISGISFSNSHKLGFKCNPDTIKWWINTDYKRFLNNFTYSNSVHETCTEMELFILIKPSIKRYWVTATLDYQGISNLFDSIGIKNPLQYDKRFCARTIRLLAEQKGYEYVRKNSHDAYENCITQIYDLKYQVDLLGLKFD